MSKMIVLKVPVRSVSLNKIYAGVSWRERRRLVAEFKQEVRAALPNELVQGDGWPVTKVDFSIEAIFSHRPMDSDNLGLAAKLIIDALKGWVVPDDDISHVGWVHLRSGLGDEDAILVTAEEVL